MSNSHKAAVWKFYPLDPGTLLLRSQETATIPGSKEQPPFFCKHFEILLSLSAGEGSGFWKAGGVRKGRLGRLWRTLQEIALPTYSPRAWKKDDSSSTFQQNMLSRWSRELNPLLGVSRQEALGGGSGVHGERVPPSRECPLLGLLLNVVPSAPDIQTINLFFCNFLEEP